MRTERCVACGVTLRPPYKESRRVSDGAKFVWCGRLECKAKGFELFSTTKEEKP